MPTDIRTLVDDFTSKLEQMIRRTALEQVEQALGGGVSAPRRGPGRPRKSAGPIRKAAKGGKRSAASLDQMQAALLAHVKAHPGQRGEQIAAALKTDVGTMRLPMKQLIAARAVRTEGQRRGMMYFAGGGGGAGPKRAKVARAGKKAGARRGKRTVAKAGAAKAEVAVAA